MPGQVRLSPAYGGDMSLSDVVKLIQEKEVK
jgi:hypothetical protein